MKKFFTWTLVAVMVLFSSASIASAALTFSGTGVSGDSGVAIDGASTISIGASTATGVTIGRSGQTATFNGSFLLGTSTLPTSSLLAIATSSNILTVLNNGDVGIGTATPDGLFQVNGLITFDKTNYLTYIGNNVGPSTLSGGSANVYVGDDIGQSDGSNSYDNSAVGSYAFNSNTAGSANSAIGANALTSNTTGINNSAMGYDALFANTTGSNNSAMGGDALGANTTGSNNVSLGYGAGSRDATDSNVFYVNNIRESNVANDQAYSLLYGNFSGVAGSLTGQQLTVNGNLYTNGNVGVGTTTTPAAQLQVVASSTLRIGVPSTAYMGCIEMYDSVNSSTLEYIYTTSGTLAATTTKPTFCQ